MGVDLVRIDLMRVDVVAVNPIIIIQKLINHAI